MKKMKFAPTIQKVKNDLKKIEQMRKLLKKSYRIKIPKELHGYVFSIGEEWFDCIVIDKNHRIVIEKSWYDDGFLWLIYHYDHALDGSCNGEEFLDLNKELFSKVRKNIENDKDDHEEDREYARKEIDRIEKLSHKDFKKTKFFKDLVKLGELLKKL